MIDENFAPTQRHAGRIYHHGVAGQRMSGRPFRSIRVDDPDNASNFTMVDTDGPLKLIIAPDDTTLFAHEGMYRYAGGGVWRVHRMATGPRPPRAPI